MSSTRFLDFSLADTSGTTKQYPEPEKERFTQPQNDQGRNIKDRDDLDKGTGTNTSSDFRSLRNYIPPRAVPR